MLTPLGVIGSQPALLPVLPRLDRLFESVRGNWRTFYGAISGFVHVDSCNIGPPLPSLLSQLQIYQLCPGPYYAK